MTTKRAAGLIIYRVGGNEIEYLLLQASYRNGHWSPPKGHLKYGENDREAAIRETREESGLAESQYDIVEEFPIVIQYPLKRCLKNVAFWLAKVKDPETPIRLSKEHQDHKWVNVTEAIKMTLSKSAEAIQKSNDFLLTKHKEKP